MKIPQPRSLLGWSVALAALSVSISVQAVPYASALTNNAGIVSFILNEPANNVKIVSNNGAVTNDLGALPKGLTITNLGISGIFRIQVSRSAPGGYTQTSVDTNSFVKFNSPRGVTVNTNPASAQYGRIYVSNSAGGATTGTGGRQVGDGIYLLNADQTDALGRGTNVSTAGIDFTLRSLAKIS